MSKAIGIDPVHTLSGFLTVLFEIGMIAGLIFLLSAKPLPVKENETIEITLHISSQAPQPATPIQPSEHPSPISPNPAPDPLFDALLAFTPSQPDLAGPTIHFDVHRAQGIEQALIPPGSLLTADPMPIQHLVQHAPPTKRTIQVVREDLLIPGREYAFEELQDFNFPNYSFVQEMLKTEYNNLLQRTPRERIHALSGVVTAVIHLQNNGGGIVQIESSPSLDLNSIVLRALHFLPQGHTYQPVTIKVRIQFGAS